MRKLLILGVSVLYMACGTPKEELLLPVGQSLNEYLEENPGAIKSDRYEAYDVKTHIINEGILLEKTETVWYDEDNNIDHYYAVIDGKGDIYGQFASLKSKYKRTIGKGQSSEEDADGVITEAWDGYFKVNGEVHLVEIKYTRHDSDFKYAEITIQ